MACFSKTFRNDLPAVVRTLWLVCVVMVASLSPARANGVDDLLDALEIDAMLEIMREEGMAYGADLGNDMFQGGENPRWQALLDRIYDMEKMRAVMHDNFDASMGSADTDPLIAFFDSPVGKEILGLELSARRALIEDEVETAARQAFLAADPESERMEQLDRFVEVNDLLEANVAGALNASFQFYSGLVDGGGLDMSEGDILSDVWSQEEETRQDTREWLYGFLLLAYQPLSDEQMETYVEISSSPEGKALNRALFAGFNAMYDEISYALGLAAAQQMQTQDL